MITILFIIHKKGLGLCNLKSSSFHNRYVLTLRVYLFHRVTLLTHLSLFLLFTHSRLTSSPPSSHPIPLLTPSLSHTHTSVAPDLSPCTGARAVKTHSSSSSSRHPSERKRQTAASRQQPSASRQDQSVGVACPVVGEAGGQARDRGVAPHSSG